MDKQANMSPNKLVEQTCW